MANNAETRVTFKVFNEEFNQAIGEMNSKSSKLRQEFALQEEQMKNNASETEKLKAKIEYLQKAEELAAQKVAATQEQLQRAKEVFGENSQEADRLSRQLLSAQTAEQRLANQITDTNNELAEQATKAQKAADAISETGEKMKGAGETMSTGVTAPIVALGAGAMLAASDVQNAAGKIQAQLGLTADEAENLGKVAQDVWKNNFGENIGEVSDNLVKVRQYIGDLTDTDLKNVTESAYTLSDAFGIDVGDSIKTAGTLTKNFDMDAQHAMDLMTVGFQQGGDYSGELLDTLNEYAPQFSSMGISAENFLGILIAGAQNGAFNLDKVGDAVKEFNIRSQDGSKTTAEGFKAIGLDADKMGQAIAAGGAEGENAFKATVAALAAMKDPVAQNTAGVNLFGSQWEDLRSTVVTSMTDGIGAINNVDGATKKAGDALYNNFGSRLQSTLRELGTALQPLGEVLLGFAEKILPPLTAAAQKLAQWFSNLSPVGQTVIIVIGAIAAAIGPLLIFIGSIVSSIGALIPVVVTVWGWLSKLGPVFTAVRTAMAALTGPIGIIIAIIAILAVVIYKNWDAIKAKTIEIWGAIKDWFTQTWTAISQGLMAAWTAVTQWLSDTWNNIKLIALTVWEALKTGVMAIITPFITGITNIFNGMKQGLTNIFEGIKLYFTGVWELIKNIFLGAILLIVDLVTGDFEGLKKDAMAIFNNLKAAFSQIWTGIKLIFTGVIQAIVGFVTGAWNNLKNNSIAVFNAVTSGISTAWTNAKNFTVSLVQSLIGGAIEKFQALKDGIANKMSEVKNKISELWNSAKSFLSSIDLSSIGRNIIQGLLNGITSMASSLYNKAQEIADGIKNKIKNALNIHSPSRVMMELGEFTGEGLAVGIENMKKTVMKASELLAQHAVPDINTGKSFEAFDQRSIKDGLEMRVANNQPIHVTVVSTLDGYEVARNQYDYINEMMASESQLKTVLNGG